MNVGYARVRPLSEALQARGGEAGTRLHLGVCVGENTNMILFAIIGESLGVVELSTIIGMLIVCWAIYTVYTGGFSDL